MLKIRPGDVLDLLVETVNLETVYIVDTVVTVETIEAVETV